MKMLVCMLRQPLKSSHLPSYCCLTMQVSSQGSLRDHTEQVDEYVIPHGDWFEIVSSPHYLAEIVPLFLFLCVCVCVCVRTSVIIPYVLF